MNQALVFRLDQVFAVCGLEAPDGEMTSGHVLEMFDEGVVHRGSAQRTDDRQGLGRELLRHNHSKAGSYLRDKAYQDWAALLDNTALREEACRLRHGLSEHTPNGEISAFRRIGRARPAPQSKYLHA